MLVLIEQMGIPLRGAALCMPQHPANLRQGMTGRNQNRSASMSQVMNSQSGQFQILLKLAPEALDSHHVLAWI